MFKVGDTVEINATANITAVSQKKNGECLYGTSIGGLFKESALRLVVDGYREEKPEYYNGKVVCVKGGNYHTVGKVYEFNDGVVSDNTEDLDYNNPIKTLKEANEHLVPKFIPFIEN